MYVKSVNTPKHKCTRIPVAFLAVSLAHYLKYDLANWDKHVRTVFEGDYYRVTSQGNTVPLYRVKPLILPTVNSLCGLIIPSPYSGYTVKYTA